jgi:hypothetical protein
MGGSSEITGHLVIPQDKVPAAAYQAIYHKLTKKVEKLTEYFDDAYIIRVSDIVQLNDMLCQATRQYKVESQSATAAISFHKDERVDNSSVEKFKMMNFSTQKPTEVIEYAFDFYTILPVELKEAEDIVQRFKVNIRIDQDFVEEDERLYVIYPASGQNIRLQVEYSDYAVGRTLQVCIQDWVKSLESTKKRNLHRRLKSRIDSIMLVVPYSFLIASIWGLSQFRIESFSGLLKALAISVLMFAIGRAAAVKLLSKLSNFEPLTFLLITAGDNARRDKIDKQRQRNRSMAYIIFASVMIGILINLFSSYIWEYIFSSAD